MFTLLSGWYKQLTRRDEYFILLIGLDNAGKTTMLERIKSIYSPDVVTLAPDQIIPTVGLNIGRVDLDSLLPDSKQQRQKCRLSFWDLGGQSDLQSIWASYYSECHAILFIVDSCDSGRLEDVRDAFNRMADNPDCRSVPILMLANKQDIKERALSVEKIKDIFNQIALKLDARDSRVFPVSALTGQGLGEAMDWLRLRLHRNQHERPPRSQ